MFRGFLGGTIAAAIGAGIWAAVALLFDYELGILAWGIGGMVGFGVALGNRGEGSQAAGILAAALAVMSVSVGKYVAYESFMPSAEEIVSDYAAGLQENEELLISYIADDVVEELEQAGQTIAWPPLPDDEFPDEEVDYPADVWTKAVARYGDMSETERGAFRDGIVADVESNIVESIGLMRAEASFATTFGPYDVLFLGLAVFTAFRIGASGTQEEELVPVTETDPPDVAGDDGHTG